MSIKLVNPQYPTEKLHASVIDILNSTELFAMATVNSAGECHIHAAYFCFSDDLDIFSVSDVGTIHAKNIAEVPRVAVSVFDSHQPWDSGHRGLQLFGKCWQAGLIESARGLKIHASRFKAYGEYMSDINPFERDKSPYKFFVFRPESIKIFDENEFGEETFVIADVRR